ncbi:MAG: nitronate monooxygenase [Desulfovibrionales bacterium]|nr:MAG: nitronate monooxygenase [Desulfovibrionales bacterium]
MTFPSLRFGDVIAKVPIVQGGMGVGISLSGLSSAVANQGGVGVISAAMIGMNEPDLAKNYAEANIRALQQEIRKAKEMTKGILGVNIMVALSNFADLVRTSIQEKIDVIFSGAGLPFDLPKYLTEGSQTKLVPIVSSGRAAAIICRKWLSKFNYLPDGFVVEGPMAGGHLGFKAEQLDDPEFQLEKLVPAVIEAVKPFEQEHGRPIPVIAAGGIFDGADICKYLRMGAAGVQLGTRFVATHECDADMAFKQAFVDAKEGDVTVIKSPVGMPGRALKNEFLLDVQDGKRKPYKCPYHCIVTCDVKKSPYCIAQALANAKKGRMKLGFAFAGQTAHRVDKMLSVKELMETLEAEYNVACAEPASA